MQVKQELRRYEGSIDPLENIQNVEFSLPYQKEKRHKKRSAPKVMEESYEFTFVIPVSDMCHIQI